MIETAKIWTNGDHNDLNVAGPVSAEVVTNNNDPEQANSVTFINLPCR